MKEGGKRRMFSWEWGKKKNEKKRKGKRKKVKSVAIERGKKKGKCLINVDEENEEKFSRRRT